MRKKIIKVALGLFILLILTVFSGCTSGSGSNNDGDINYLRGTQGIEHQFLRGSPPNNVYNGDTFGVGLELMNKGVTPALVYYFFTGFDPYVFAFDHSFGSIMMNDARTQYNFEGGYDIVEALVTVYTPPESDSFTQPIKAIVCYDYETKVEAPICIDPQPNKGDTDDVCQAGPGEVGGGQGAPVAVTSITQEAQPWKTRFKVTVSNVGGGQVLDHSITPYCIDPHNRQMEYDRVYIECVWLGNEQACLPCEPNPVLIRDGGGTFYCRHDMIGTTTWNAYKTLLNMRLSYGYKNTIEKTILVKPSD